MTNLLILYFVVPVQDLVLTLIKMIPADCDTLSRDQNGLPFEAFQSNRQCIKKLKPGNFGINQEVHAIDTVCLLNRLSPNFKQTSCRYVFDRQLFGHSDIIFMWSMYLCLDISTQQNLKFSEHLWSATVSVIHFSVKFQPS